MNIEQLLIQSLQLFGLGMGSVFIILSLLIIIITIVSKLVPEEQPAIVKPVQAVKAHSDKNHVAAIQAGIHQYRNK